MSSVKDIIALLPTLSPEDRVVLSNQLKVYETVGLSSKKKKTVDTLLYNVLADLLGTKLGTAFPPFDNFCKGPAIKQYETAVKFLDDWIPQVFGPVNKLQKKKLMVICVEATIMWMKSAGITLFNQTVCSMLSERLPSIIDQSFPGYLESGLMRKLVDAQVIDDGSDEFV